MSNVVMYLIANSSVPMSKGKFGAQAAHAAVEAFQRSTAQELEAPAEAPSLIEDWYNGGHYTKIVLMADDLAVAERYLNDRGFETVLIIDEGRTEFDGRLTPTFIGCALVDKDDPHVSETFGTFRLYKEPKPAPAPPQRKGVSGLFCRVGVHSWWNGTTRLSTCPTCGKRRG